MKYFLMTLVFGLLFSWTSRAQQDHLIKHTVTKGETVTQIAQKYKVTPYDIFRLNPDAQNGLREQMVLLIPKSSSAVITPSNTAVLKDKKTHTVAPKETLFGIARQHEITAGELEEANKELLINGLQPGQVLTIPVKRDMKEMKLSNGKPAVDWQKKTDTLFHEIQPKETKYGVARQYGLSIEELEKLNPEIKDSFPIGHKLIIKVHHVFEKETGTVKDASVVSPKEPYSLYTVQPKETLYRLTKTFNVTQEELFALNPELKEGVREGMIIKVPSSALFFANTKKPTNLAITIRPDAPAKDLVLLLPFNLAKIEKDSSLSVQERLKRDSFLTMTLDFYMGALMAIDSAKALGIPVQVRVYDSQEDKSASNVKNVIKSHDFSNVGAVIGPFYPQYAEKAASLLQSDSIFVISPLRETTKHYSNLLQSMPSKDYVRDVMLNYILNQNGNKLAIIDKGRESVRKYLDGYQSKIKHIALDDKGFASVENLKTSMVSGQTNYVFLDSHKIGFVVNAINSLIQLQKEFDIQLVVLERTDIYDVDEVSIKKLTRLKMLFPSVTNDIEYDGSLRFANQYRKINNIFPNQFASRGFDVTFDALLRLSQGVPFEMTLNEYATEYVENKFNYIKKNGYVNEGVYVLYYDEDLTIKKAQ